MNAVTEIARPVSLFVRAILVFMAVFCMLVTAGRLDQRPRTEDAEIRANVIGVAPQVSGSIERIRVVDNQRVKRGDLLFEIDARTYQAEVDQARARLDAVTLEVRALADEITAAEATLNDRRARGRYAKAHYERLKPLLEGNFASIDRVQQAEMEAESATQVIAEAEAALARARNRLGEFEGRNVRIEEARAALQNAELRLAYCKVFAPCDGTVTNLQIAPGAFAREGEEVFSVVDESVWFVLANFRETDLRRIEAGQEAEIFLMAGSGSQLRGIVQGISRAVAPMDGASIALPGGEGLLSRVQPTFDFVQLAARFPVRIVVEPGNTSGLRVGGRAAVVINSEGPLEIERLRQLQQVEAEPFSQPADE